jgi:hypothetical protein
VTPDRRSVTKPTTREVNDALTALRDHELGPAVGMTEHCVCGWGWSSRWLAGGYEAGCWAREEALEILIEAGLV